MSEFMPGSVLWETTTFCRSRPNGQHYVGSETSRMMFDFYVVGHQLQKLRIIQYEMKQMIANYGCKASNRSRWYSG